MSACDCRCASTVARLEEDLHAVIERVSNVETAQQETDTHLIAIQSAVNRCLAGVTRQEQASRETTRVLKELHSMMSDMRTRLQPSVEVGRG